jgi:23S rRNA (uracil1939-C5)-methyltransferase
MLLTIEKMVYGGAGLARTEQGVVFVPRTAPGDVLEAEITEKKKDYAVARTMELLERSPDRQEPWCPNYATAGCCHWQHIRYERQLEIKEEIVRESLQRLGRLSWDGPIQRISGPDRNYRMRATFHVSPHGELGFMREKSNVVEPIRECSALAPELNAFIQQSRGPFAGSEVTAVSTSSLEVLGMHYRVDPETFFQANRFILAPFVEEVVFQAGDSSSLLELYSGSGFFSLHLAAHTAELIAVESNTRSVRQALANAMENNVRNAKFVEADVENWLGRSGLKPDVIVLNPPRAGAGSKNAVCISGLSAERIVYVSCNPSTFAREAAVFNRAGYSLQRLTMVDQFPNTYHIEIVGMFHR